MTGLAHALEQAMSLELGSDAAALETYVAACNTPESFSGFIHGLIHTAFWRAKAPDGGDLPVLCEQLAAVIDEDAAQGAEPAYHSRRHFKEVCLAVSLLLRAGQDLLAVDGAANPWALADKDCWILLLAAIAHDFGHEGRPNRTAGELEEKACDLVARFQQTHPNLDRRVVATVQALIRATEPSLYTALTQVAASHQAVAPLDVMKVLLVEADLFASMLPHYGVGLGALLAQEFEPHAPALAELIASPVGRKGFLEAHPYASPNADRLGFNEVIHSAIICTQPAA